jgi:hypothetical protein
MIQTIQLTPGVVLRHYPDKRFKTAVLSVQFQRPLCREEAALNALSGGAVIIDLASLPGGVDKECAEKLGISVIHALALPGKYMPETSAKIIRACVRSFIKERIL